jgi:hypothetical protein
LGQLAPSRGRALGCRASLIIGCAAVDDIIGVTDRDDLDPWKSAGGSTLGDGTMLGVAVAAGAGRRGWGCSTTGRRLVKANRSAINGLGQRQANGHQLIELIVLIKLG